MFGFGKNRWKEDFDEKAYSLAPKLYRLAFSRLGNAQDAEDLVQETFIKAFRAFKTFRQGENIEAWLVTILINTIRDHVRRVSKAPTSSLNEEPDEFNIADLSAGPEEKYLVSELQENILDALKSIPESMSMPLLLREIHDMTYKDIAEVLDVPIGTVMSRLSRSRQLLRNVLADKLDFPSDDSAKKSNKSNGKVETSELNKKVENRLHGDVETSKLNRKVEKRSHGNVETSKLNNNVETSGLNSNVDSSKPNNSVEDEK